MNEQKELLTTIQKALTINLDASEVRHVRGDRGRPGGRARVLPGRRGVRDDRQVDLRVRHGLQRRHLREGAPVRLARAPEADARPRVQAPRSSASRRRGATGRTSSCSRTRSRRATTRAPTRRTAGWASGSRPSPKGEPSEIVLHVRMWDKEAVLQQQALGIVGVNFIYGALYYRERPGEADRVAPRQPGQRPDRDRHAPLLGPGVRERRQPADVALPRQVRAHERGHVRAEAARSSSRPRCCTRRRSSSSGAASGP